MKVEKSKKVYMAFQGVKKTLRSKAPPKNQDEDEDVDEGQDEGSKRL